MSENYLFTWENIKGGLIIFLLFITLKDDVQITNLQERLAAIEKGIEVLHNYNSASNYIAKKGQ